MLDLSSTDTYLHDDDMGRIGRAVGDGVLAGLEELVLSNLLSVPGNQAAAGIIGIAHAIARGNVRKLRRLVLSYEMGIEGDGVGEAVAACLRTGRLEALEELDLSHLFFGVVGLSGITQSLEEGCCPELRVLRVSRCHLLPEDGRALGAALKAGVCPKLEVGGGVIEQW